MLKLLSKNTILITYRFTSLEQKEGEHCLLSFYFLMLPNKLLYRALTYKKTKNTVEFFIFETLKIKFLELKLPPKY